MKEHHINRGWGVFALTFLAAILYYSACTGAGLYISTTPDLSLILLINLAAIILLPLIVWMIITSLRRRHADEYERQLTDRSLAWSAQWAVLFIVLMNIVHLFIPAIKAPGIFVLPGLYAMAFVLMRQVIKFLRISQ